MTKTSWTDQTNRETLEETEGKLSLIAMNEKRKAKFVWADNKTLHFYKEHSGMMILGKKGRKRYRRKITEDAMQIMGYGS